MRQNIWVSDNQRVSVTSCNFPISVKVKHKYPPEIHMDIWIHIICYPLDRANMCINAPDFMPIWQTVLHIHNQSTWISNYNGSQSSSNKFTFSILMKKWNLLIKHRICKHYCNCYHRKDNTCSAHFLHELKC